MTRSYAAFTMIIALIMIVRPTVAQSDAEQNDFEGAYQVGTTTCTVVPGKMTFEVRWHGRAKPEYYFYNEAKSIGTKAVFETDPGYNSGVIQSFIFETRSSDLGVFVRSDGKKLKVVRKTPTRADH